MLCEIARSHQVTYVALKDDAVDLHPDEANAPYAQTKIWIKWRETRKGSALFFRELFSNLFLSTQPYSLTKYKSESFAQAIRELCKNETFDLIVCDFLFPAPNLEDLPAATPTVLFQHNMEAQIWKRLAEGKKNPVARWYFHEQFRRMHEWEELLSRRFSGIITVSPEDTKYARDTYQLDNVLGDVPTGVDTSYFKPTHPKETTPEITVGFLGSMDWMPNIESVHWFVNDIFPSIRQHVSNIKFLIIGRRPPRSVTSLAEKDTSIEVTGSVEDVRPYLGRCDMLVVPLRSGGGTRIKIMEALAAELPVVSTSVGAEGLGLVDGEHILIADSAEDFAKSVCLLAANASLRKILGTTGASLVEAKHGWGPVTDDFLDHCVKLLPAKENT